MEINKENLSIEAVKSYRKQIQDNLIVDDEDMDYIIKKIKRACIRGDVLAFIERKQLKSSEHNLIVLLQKKGFKVTDSCESLTIHLYD